MACNYGSRYAVLHPKWLWYMYYQCFSVICILHLPVVVVYVCSVSSSCYSISSNGPLSCYALYDLLMLILDLAWVLIFSAQYMQWVQYASVSPRGCRWLPLFLDVLPQISQNSLGPPMLFWKRPVPLGYFGFSLYYSLMLAVYYGCSLTGSSWYVYCCSYYISTPSYYVLLSMVILCVFMVYYTICYVL